MPKLSDHPGNEFGYNQQAYEVALRYWAEVCNKVIEGNEKIANAQDGDWT